jgi:hypothetical protein
MVPCYNHPDRPAVVLLDWNEDGAEYCVDCIVPTLTELTQGALPLQANCGEAVAHISLISADA